MTKNKSTPEKSQANVADDARRDTDHISQDTVKMPDGPPSPNDVEENQSGVETMLRRLAAETMDEATDGSLVVRRFGKYVVERMLSCAGQAVVFLAYDPDLNRRVVLKLYLQGASAQNDRMRNEGRALAQIESPHVARCHGVEHFEDCVFLVLEFVDGATLGDKLAIELPSVETALQITRQLAAGLEPAHRAGLIHGDVKPSNVIVTESGNVKLIDFGLVRSLPDVDSPTRSGTAAYMPPEFAKNQTTVDARSDVFGLGATLFHMLTGQPPFNAENSACSLELAKVGTVTEARSLESKIPRRVNELVMRCLEDRPARRFSSVDDLIRAIDQIDDQPAWRTTLFSSMAAGIILALAVGLWSLLSTSTSPHPLSRTPLTESQFEKLLETHQEFKITCQPIAADGQVALTDDDLLRLEVGKRIILRIESGLDCSVAVFSVEHDGETGSHALEPLFPSPHQTNQRNILAAGEQCEIPIIATKSMGDDFWLIVGSTEQLSARSLLDLALSHPNKETSSQEQSIGRGSRALDPNERFSKRSLKYRVCEKGMVPSPSRKNPQDLELKQEINQLRDKAESAAVDGNFPLALAILSDAVEVLDTSALDVDDFDQNLYELLIEERASLAECVPNFEVAIRSVEQLIEIRKDTMKRWDAVRLEVLRAARDDYDEVQRRCFVDGHRVQWLALRLFNLYHSGMTVHQSEWNQALASAEQAHSIFAEGFSATHLLALHSSRIAELARFVTGSASPPEFMVNRYETFKKTLGAQHPFMVRASVDAGIYSARNNDPEAATVYFQQAVQLASTIHGIDSNITRSCKSRLASTLRTSRRISDAIVIFEELLASEPEHSLNAVVWHGELSECAMLQQNFPLAVEYARRSVAGARRAVISDPSLKETLLFSVLGLARGLAWSGRADETQPLLDEFVSLAEEVYGDGTEFFAVSLRESARIAHMSKNPELAIQYLTDAFDMYQSATKQQGALMHKMMRDLGTLHRDMGNFEQATEWFRRELEHGKRVTSRKPKDDNATLGQIATAELLRGNMDVAYERFTEAINLCYPTINALLPYYQPEDAIALMSGVSARLSGLVQSQDPNNAKQVRQTFSHIWRSKGRVTQSQAIRSRWFRADAEQGDVYSQLQEQLAGATLNSLKERSVNAEQSELLRRAEKETRGFLTDAFGASRDYLREAAIGEQSLAELGMLLPANVAIVEVLRVGKVIPPDIPGPFIIQHGYAAFVLRHDADAEDSLSIDFVDLGPADPIDTNLDEWIQQLVKQTYAPRSASHNVDRAGSRAPAEKLEQLVWSKLEQPLRECKHVVICPDGPICRLPWPALLDQNGENLARQFSFSQAADAQSVLSALKTKRRSEGYLLAVGAPKFGAAPRSSGHNEITSPARSLPGSWTSLPGTRREIDSICQIWGDTNVVRLTREDATESSVREKLKDASYVEIASHGFFISPEDIAQDIDITSPHWKLSQILDRNPMIASGIVLAGANGPTSEQGDDQYLTGAEVINMDLSKLELVTLSACDSGLGKILYHEGASGIKQAFLLAGARATLTSGWRVDDTAAVEFMEEFYTNLWKKKQTKATALRNAQITMIDQMPPGKWAGWVLDGDWR